MSRRPATGTGARGKLLHRSLTANAVFSGASGALLATASGPIAAFLGWTNSSAPPALLGVGAALLAFATALALAARAPRPNETVVRNIVALDVVWVLGSALLLVLGLAPSGRGAAIIGGVAVVVALLAAGQAVGLARTSGSTAP